MKGSILNYENTFYLNGAALSGISSVDGSYQLDYKPINVIGNGFIKQVLASVPTASLSLNRYLVNNDPIFDLTGNGINYLAESASGGLYYKNKYFSFNNGYLSSFEISCNVGEIPTIGSKFDIFGDIGPTSNPTGDVVVGGVFVPQVKNITVTCRNSTTNRVKDFNISFDCPNIPIYGLSANNAEIPIEVQNMLPIEVNTSFILDIDDYETKKVFDDLTADGTTSFKINVSGTILEDEPLETSTGSPPESLTVSSGSPPEVLYAFLKLINTTPIFNFDTSDAIITSEEINSNADDVLSVKLSYKSYLN